MTAGHQGYRQDRLEAFHPLSVSVVIPAYNAARYLPIAINSALAQSYKPLEVIVVDDGSTDDTDTVLRAYAESVIRVRQRNAGVSSARNVGIERARGAWVAFLDADDAWHPSKLELQIGAVLARPHTIVVYSNWLVTEHGRQQEVTACPPESLPGVVTYRCPFMPSAALVAREALTSVGGFDPRFSGVEDWDLWARLLERYSADSFIRVCRPLVVYNVVEGSLSSDARRLLELSVALLDSRLLTGLRGFRRLVRRRKSMARILRDAAVALRETGDRDCLRLIVCSLLSWPFNDAAVQSDRYRLFGNMLFKRHRIAPGSPRS